MKIFRRFFSAIDRLHWLWLALAAPFLLFPNPARTPAMLVVPGTWLLHWLVARGRRIKKHPGYRAPFLPLTPLNGILLLLAVMVLVSEWATYDLAFSLPKISGAVLGIGIYYAIARLRRRKGGWGWSLVAFVGIGLGMAALGLLGTNWFNWKISLLNPITSHIPKLVGGLQGAESGFHPNEIAGALSWVLPLMIVLCFARLTPSPTEKGGWGLKARPWWLWLLRIALWLSTLFMGAVFVLTQSRTAYLALALTLALMFWLVLPGKGRWIFLGLMVAVGIAGGAYLSGERITQGVDWLTGSGVVSEQAFSLNSLESRLEVWSRAIYGLQDFPFTGMGMNTFRQVVHVLYPLFMIAPDVEMGHAHNEFLQAGLDLGIPGMIALIALYIGAFWMLSRVWRHYPIFNLQRVAALGLGGGLFAHLLYGLTDAVALGAKPGLLFWMLLGLIAGLFGQVFKSRDVIESEPVYTEVEND